MKCPICNMEMELGFIHAPSSNASFWLPKDALINDDIALSNKKIEDQNGIVLGKTTKVALLSKHKPESYHCPACKILITKLDT